MYASINIPTKNRADRYNWSFSRRRL